MSRPKALANALRPTPAPGRLAMLGLTALGCLVLASVDADRSRGQDDPAPPPAGADLLHSIPFDRITLNDNAVILVDPVSPRPLPAYDPSKDPARTPFRVPKEGNVGVKGKKSNVEMPGEREKEEERANEVTVHLLKGEVKDFRVKRNLIKRIDYFEDLLMAEGDRWLRGREFARAFECYLRVQTREPGWAGLDERVNRLLFEEGSAALLDGDGERGLRLLRELFVRKPNFPGLTDKLAKAYGTRAARAFELGLYARGRKILHDLEPLAPNHPIVGEIRARFIARARSLAEEAARKTGAARVDNLALALRVWPELDGGAASFSKAFADEPTLDVAVNDVPRPVGPWIHAPADERVTRLLYLPILAHDDDDAAQGKSSGQLAAGLEASSLGRKLTLQLRSGPAWSDGSRPVSAIDVVRAFTDRTEPASPQYNARWAEALQRIETPDPSRIEIRLNRAALRPGYWLLAPVGPAHGGWDGRVATGKPTRELVSDGPYRWLSAGPDELQLAASSGGSSAAPRVRRVREVRVTGGKAILGALARGEVSVVEHVPTDLVATFASSPEVKVGRYSRPALHFIAIDGRNPLLRNRALRRGLSYVIDRKTLLEETLLKHPADADNLVADGPFARGSAADAIDVAPLEYKPFLAKMLMAAARKELSTNTLSLVLEYPSIPEAQAVVPRIVEALRLIDVEIVAKERPESALEAELRSGRTFDLAYRVARPGTAELEAGPLLCPGYDAPGSADAFGSLASPRILQLLLQLERAQEWPSAKGIATQIDRECRDELPILPLWQLQEHYAWRTRLTGPAESAERLYEGIKTWEIAPWYARDPW